MSETGLAFLLAYACGLGMALVIRPVFGLYTYVAVFYLHPPSRWWGAMLPDLRWSLLAAIVTLVAVLIHARPAVDRLPWYRSGIVLVFLAYTMWMWVQLVWVPSPYQIDGAVLFTKYTLLIALIYVILDNERDVYNFCLAHVIGCGYLGWLVYQAPDAGRLEGVGGPGIDDANTLGMHLSSGLIFASFLLLFKGKARWLVLLMIPFILNGVIQTETRGAIIGLVLGVVAMTYLKPRQVRKAYYALGVLAIVGVLALANESFIERMQSFTAAVDEEQEWDNSASSRIAIAEAQLRMFLDYPLGVGHQGTAYLSREYLEERWLASNSGTRASHNTLLSVLVDQGIPGIFMLSTLGVALMFSVLKLKRLDKKGLSRNLGMYRAMIGGALVAIFGSGMFAQHLKAEVQVWCLALFAVLWALAQRECIPADSAKVHGRSHAGVSRFGSHLVQ